MTLTLPEAPPRPRTAPTSQPASSDAASGQHPPAPRVDPHVITRLVLSGALVDEDCARLTQLLDDHAASPAGIVEVDLSAVQRIEGGAARAFLHADWRLEATGRRLVLVRPQPQVRRVLRFYAADHLILRERRRRPVGR